VVVPIRSFVHAKERLAVALDDGARHALIRELAGRVIDAARGQHIAIVSSDDEVVRFASDRSVVCLPDPGTLDTAADAGREWARQIGAERVAIVHADLPFVENLDPLVAPADAWVAVLVPDQRGDGTPALSVPIDAPFAFAYGPGSFARHLAAAVASGLQPRVLHDARLGFDVDLPEDLETLAGRILPT